MTRKTTCPPIRLRIGVMVTVDPADEELIERIQQSGGALSVADVVCNEIESNLESVSYVTAVAVAPLNQSTDATERRPS
jgi:hypothetical protein